MEKMTNFKIGKFFCEKKIEKKNFEKIAISEGVFLENFRVKFSIFLANFVRFFLNRSKMASKFFEVSDHHGENRPAKNRKTAKIAFHGG